MQGFTIALVFEGVALGGGWGLVFLLFVFLTAYLWVILHSSFLQFASS